MRSSLFFFLHDGRFSPCVSAYDTGIFFLFYSAVFPVSELRFLRAKAQWWYALRLPWLCRGFLSRIFLGVFRRYGHMHNLFLVFVFFLRWVLAI